MKHLLFAGLFLVGATLLFAQPYQLGSKVEQFSVQDLSGNPVAFQSGAGVTVVLFVSVQCPVSNAYNGRMNEIYRDYSAKGVKFAFLNSNVAETAADVGQHAKENLVFPVFKDQDNAVADRFGAQVTPEAFVLDASGKLVYRGAIDDQRTEARVQNKSLRSALDSVLAGKLVENAQTKAFGCTIKRKKL